MRYLTILLVATLLTSCSWSLPFLGGTNSGNCLDDDSCEGANPFEEQLVGGKWYCYGVARDEPWDCSQEEDPDKIAALTDPVEPSQAGRGDFDISALLAGTAPATNSPSDDQQDTPQRAELNFSEGDSDTSISSADKSAGTELTYLDAYTNDSYAVQLIALQTEEEVNAFARDHDIETPNYVMIESQGSLWFVLILDVFAEKSMADQAAAQWIETHEPNSRPWVRPVGTLKEAARRAEG